MSTSIYRIASFPLNTFLLPGEEIPLRIFEPRYKQLIAECHDTGRPFVIPYLTDTSLATIASKVELVSIDGRHDNGNMVVTIRCEELVHLVDVYDELQGKLYGGALVQPLDKDFATSNAEIIVLAKKLKLNFHPQMGSLITKQAVSILELASGLMLTSEQKYRLVSLGSKHKMEAFMLVQLRFIEFIRQQELRLENNYQLN